MSEPDKTRNPDSQTSWTEHKSLTHYFPANFLKTTPGGSSNSQYVLLLLNSPLHEGFLRHLWGNSLARVVADGGANQLYDVTGGCASYTPTVIIGDLDSIRPEVKSHYEKLITVIKEPDQVSTDFGKAIDWITKSKLPQQVLAYTSLGGRVDQGFHSIHQLYLTSGLNLHLYLISEDSMTFLLKPGKNILHLPHDVFWKTCGIIPVGQTSIITTKGLAWDVENWETKFGGKISTSNHLKDEVVEIITDTTIVFTVEIRWRDDWYGKKAHSTCDVNPLKVH